MTITNQEIYKKVAVHEAGHAVMVYLRRMEVYKIAIDFENENTPGYIDWNGIDSFIVFPNGRQRGNSIVRKYLYTDLLINLAGIKAEQLIIGWANTRGFVQDNERAWERVQQLTTGKDYYAQSLYMDWVSNTTTRMLKPYTVVLLAIANRLLQQGSIDGSEFSIIMKDFQQ